MEKLNEDKKVHGILLQHPVPSQIDDRLCFDAIDINKDAIESLESASKEQTLFNKLKIKTLNLMKNKLDILKDVLEEQKDKIK